MTSYASKYLLPFRPLLILSYLTETHFPPSLLINCLDSLRAQMAFLLGSSCILTELTGLTRLTQPGITVNTQPTTPPPSHTDACSHRHTGTGSRNSTPVLAPRESHHPKWHFHPIFSALLLKTLKTQNPPDCPPREKQRLHGTTTHWDTTQLWNRHMANRPR